MQDLLTDISTIIQSGAGIALVVIGLLVGIILALILNAARGKSGGSTSDAALNELQNEFDGYKEQVNSHFSRTSELVGQLTSDYRAVYEHLATSADSLCTVDASGQPLGFPQVELIQNEKVVSSAAEATAADNSLVEAEPAAEVVAEATETDSNTSSDENGPSEPEPETKKPEASSAEAPVAASIPESITAENKS